MTIQLFKWMMALAVMLYLPLFFEQVKGFRRQDRKHSDEYIKNRVESIYFDVTHFYNQLNELKNAQAPTPDPSPARGGEKLPETWPDFDRLYCSDAWNAQLAAVLQKEERMEQQEEYRAALSSPQGGGDAGFREEVEGGGTGNLFTRNYWLGHSTLGFLYINKVEVIDRTGDCATVSLNLHNGNLVIPVLLVMNFEHDDWQIDNMTYYWNEKPSTRYYDWRQEMSLQ